MEQTQILSPDRRKYLGGSDIAAILGISIWKTPLDVYLDKVQPRVESISPDNLRVLDRGKRMEPYVVDILSEETGLSIIRRNERYTHSKYDFIRAEIDAEAESGENIEIKTVSPFKAKEWGEEKTDEIPIYYAAQAMHGLMVTGKAVCVFGVLIGGDDFRVYRILRDEETIAAIEQKELEFWERIIQRNPPDPSTVSDVIRLFGSGDAGLAVETSDAIEEAYHALKRLKAEEKEIKAAIDAREDRIKLYLGEASILTLHGSPILTWKAQEPKRFDIKAFQIDYPELYEQFRKTTKSRVLRLK
jgi:putative phage-type endonuclease